MANIKDTAKDYVPPQTLNIAELNKVDITELEVKKDHGTDKDGKPYEYMFVEVDGQRYRMPGVVLGGIKAIIEEKPDARFVKVKKSGAGLGTTYQVIQVD